MSGAARGGRETGGSAAIRIALLGQKDALARALCDLRQLCCGRRLEVLVLLPRAPRQALPSVGLDLLCESLGFRHVFAFKDDVVLSELTAFRPELIVSILWPRRIKEEVLALCKDCINFHPSLLPRHRGSMTQFWAILEDDAEAGATCHRMVRDFDAGRILHQETVAISPEETALSLNLKMACTIERCFYNVIRLFLAPGGLPPGQDWHVEEFPYHRKGIVNDGVIDPEWSDDFVDRFVRAMFFPPHEPAVAVSADGACHEICTLSEFVTLRSRLPLVGRRPPPPSPPPSSPAAPVAVGAEAAASPAACAAAAVSAAPAAARSGAAGGAAAGRAGAAAAVLLAVLLAAWQGSEVWRDSPFAATSGGVERLAERHSLEGHPRARCLDGSPAAYYLSPGSGAGHRKYVIYFQGGGWCTESPSLASQAGYSHDEHASHPDLCSSRRQGYHGSSVSDRPQRCFRGNGFLSGDPSENPMMHDWNRVLVRNCDGTAFLSSLAEPLEVGGSPLYFRGRDNVLAVVDDLVAKHDLADATEVVLSGCSAGGVAAVLLADELRARMASASRRPAGAFVAALSDSGVFPAWASAPPPQGVLSFPQFEWIYSNTNASGGAPAKCLAQGLGALCLRVGMALPFVSTPVFVLMSAADSWHLSDPVGADALRVLGRRIREEVTSAIRAPHAAAVDSCFHHCQEWGKIRWGAQTNADAFRSWYELRKKEWLASPGEGTDAERMPSGGSFEGWPLMHVAEAWMDRCSAGQEQHRAWHSSLPRLVGE